VVRQSGLPNVEALGFVSGQPLEDLVRNASFILVPSEWMENNPMSVIEANGYGKPTISAAIGGVPEIVINGKTGFLFTPGDVDELSASIRHATDMNDKEYENMSDDTYQFAVDNFSPEAHYKRLMKIYEKAINLKQ
jgi:glycosyltransferase involved in cell wall biosynthesis